MEDELLAEWVRCQPEERESIMCVHDPELVHLIKNNMQMLCSSEIQARQFGVKGMVDPFDRTQLPLLWTMEFDRRAQEGEQVLNLVKWPKVFHEDPMILPNILRCALRSGSTGRRIPQVLRPQRWSQLLQPAAKSWVDFEKQLALLVEQLVLSACSTRPPYRTCGQAVGDAGAAEDEEGSEAVEANQAPASHVPGAARAAKRARQRERRRIGKAQGAAAAVEGASVGCTANVPAIAPEFGLAAAEPFGAQDAELAQAVRPISARPTEEEGEEDRGVGNAAASFPAESQQRSHEAGVGAAGEVAGGAAVPGEDEPSSEAQLGSPDTEEWEFPSMAAELSQGASARGVGRGRPMGGEQQGPWIGMHGRGVGRGRALAPPPGLQGLQFQRSDKIPGGLSQPWIPGPPIPEDEDESCTPLQHWAAPQGPLDVSEWVPPSLELPGSVLDLGGDIGSTPSYAERTPSYWASYAPTPAQRSSPPDSPGPRKATFGNVATADPAGGDASSLLGGAGAPGAEFSAFRQGVIPMYVTVPLAMAHMCPHCGKHFAVPPGTEVQAAGLGLRGGQGHLVQDPPG